MGKLDEAISYCSSTNEFEKGLKILNELILNPLLVPNIRAKALIALFKIAPDEAIDKMARLRDSLPFYENEKKKEKEIEFICSLVKYPQINSHERLLSAVCLYNNDYIEYCYPLFEHLANDISVLIDYRVEATRYLLYSDIYEYAKVAKKCVLAFIDTKEYPSEYRYKIIAGFNTKTGLSTLLNREKLNVEYDEKFLYKLQNKFFRNKENDCRNRILSGQHLLDIGITSDKEKSEIGNELLEIATTALGKDEDDTENIRADAADVVLRLGTETQKTEARKIIQNLGIINGKKIQKLTEKQRTAYSDRQNVHDSSINRSVNEFIEKLVMKNKDKVDSFQVTHSEVTDLIYKANLVSKDRIKAFKALNRISIDTATFTDMRITTAEIFVHIWRLMKKHSKEEFEELRKRLIEELIDMADTCSSGHAARLINILSGYDVQLKISWKDQIHANMAARMQKRIQDIQDEELQQKVVMGMIDDAEEEDRDAFLQFVTDQVKSLKKELYKEFVDEGYINKNEFNAYFEEGTSKWI